MPADRDALHLSPSQRFTEIALKRGATLGENPEIGITAATPLARKEFDFGKQDAVTSR